MQLTGKCTTGMYQQNEKSQILSKNSQWYSMVKCRAMGLHSTRQLDAEHCGVLCYSAQSCGSLLSLCSKTLYFP